MSDLPVSRITLFSSGVGFFEHRGSVAGTEEITLPFNINAINDALKSLVINDPAGCPSVSYPSEETYIRTLKSLSININGSSLKSILQSLRGTEITVFVPEAVKGRIILAERRTEEANNAHIHKDFLSIFTDNGIKTICIDEINHFVFSDPKITEDLNRALDLAIKSRDDKTCNLTIKLAGDTGRNVSFGYVIPCAVWKVSYRLNLSAERPFLQGWAIVDNNSDIDWNNIELALVTGKPVSFIQDLYKVHNISRPIIPLLTDGIAEVRTYDSGSSRKILSPNMEKSVECCMVCDEMAEEMASDDYEQTGAFADTAIPRPAGDQFEFAIKKPVNLARQQSAMLPLIEGAIQAEKFLVFSREGKEINGVYNPAICVELTNNTGMKLPAGPITVYDGRTYAGDALVKFFPEEEKRLISYGEDLSVTGSFTSGTSKNTSLIKIDKGFMTTNTKMTYKTMYTFRNAGKESKKIIIEHPIMYKSTLVKPSEYNEKTHNLYRFTETLPPSADFINFEVIEERIICEEIEITNFNYDKLAAFLSNHDNSQEAAQTALQRAFNLNANILKAQNALNDLKAKSKKLVEKQERTRKNLEAAGAQSQQGKDYLQRLVQEDADIDALEEKINAAVIEIETAQKEYENYLLGLKIQ